MGNPRFAANLDDVMPWGGQMVRMMVREIEDFQPQQVNQFRQTDLWRRFADSDDERTVIAATSSHVAGVAKRAAAISAAASGEVPTADSKAKPASPIKEKRKESMRKSRRKSSSSSSSSSDSSVRGRKKRR